MSRFKLSDPQNVLTKSGRMMAYHITLFERHLGPCRRENAHYLFDEDGAAVDVFYETGAKLLTKTFATRVRMRVPGLRMPYSWEAKSQLAGHMRATGIFFRDRGRSPTTVVQTLNGEAAFLDALFGQTQKVDLISIELTYRQDDAELTVDLNPYPGAFVWVKLPPLYYDIRFQEGEVEALVNILRLIKDYFDAAAR